MSNLLLFGLLNKPLGSNILYNISIYHDPFLHIVGFGLFLKMC